MRIKRRVLGRLGVLEETHNLVQGWAAGRLRPSSSTVYDLTGHSASINHTPENSFNKHKRKKYKISELFFDPEEAFDDQDCGLFEPLTRNDSHFKAMVENCGEGLGMGVGVYGWLLLEGQQMLLHMFRQDKSTWSKSSEGCHKHS